MLPGLALAPRLLPQGPSSKPRFRVNGLSQITLSVSDVQRSLAFYQGLFGMPIQARQGSTVLLRIGSGPRFLALKPVEAGERPSISALGFGVHDFALDRALQTSNLSPDDARTAAVSAALSRIWDCARARLTALERAPSGPPR